MMNRWKRFKKSVLEAFGNGPSTREGWEQAGREAGEARRVAEIEFCEKLGRTDLVSRLEALPPSTYDSDEQLIEIENLTPDALKRICDRTDEVLTERWKREGKPWLRD